MSFEEKPFTQDGAAICERLEAIYDRLGSMLSRQVHAEMEPKAVLLSADDLHSLKHR